MRTRGKVIGSIILLGVVAIAVSAASAALSEHAKELEDTRNELTALRKRVQLACKQQAASYVTLSRRLASGKTSVDDGTSALVHSSTVVWLCTGDWPKLEVILSTDPVRVQSALDELIPQLDPERRK